MSRILTSPDIVRLIKDGYSVRVTDQYLIVSDIPYLTRDGKVRTNGMVASALERDQNGYAKRPSDHMLNFFGDELPCEHAGQPLDIRVGCGSFVIDKRTALALCSRHKKGGDYVDYYEKMTSYISYIMAPALKVDASVTARNYKPPIDETEASVFTYGDSATPRNGTGDLAARLAGQKVAIVGIGGTGSYVLDAVAKTPVSEIRLFDGDKFYSHNAFRAPGAAPQNVFGKQKVDYYASAYSMIHKGIKPYAVNLDADNLALLDGVEFVFMCLDEPQAKGSIVRFLQERGIPFIDTGMDVVRRDGVLGGSIRATFCSADETGQQTAQKYIDMMGKTHDNEYDANIQIVELNSLNAALAVIRWKRHCGFYGASDRRRCVSYDNMVYSLSGDQLHHEKNNSETL